MGELLHKKHNAAITDKATSPHELLQQINTEDEFAAEIALLKAQALQPREQAVTNLLNMIQEQAATVEH